MRLTKEWNLEDLSEKYNHCLRGHKTEKEQNRSGGLLEAAEQSDCLDSRSLISSSLTSEAAIL